MSQVTCPRCGNSVDGLQRVDPGVIAKIQESGSAESIPEQVCATCYTQLAGSVARGSVLLAREKAKEQKKIMLWKSRVNLIKKARQCMRDKMFSDAAVAYEKYIKVLEMVFDAKPGELTPEAFKESARTQELTVVASTYWDLLRIYDTSPKYGDRQAATAKKLAEFLRFTPIFPDIIRKAESFQKTAKNPEVIRSFLKMAASDKGRCFIATAAFQYHSPEVQALTEFRETVLMKSPAGRLFVKIYYTTSPAIAQILDKYSVLRPPVQFGLRKIIALLQAVRISASRHYP